MRQMMFRTVLTFLAGVFVTVAAAAPAYYIQADTVRGGEGVPRGAVCVANSVFFTGESIVWRAKVFDTATGEALTAEQVEQRGIKVVVSMDNGQSVDLAFQGHPPGADFDMYFTGHFVIPDDAPTGTINWTLTATDNQGNSATFEPLGQKAGLALTTIVHE